jgi:1-acyl-sn-glycerol-3-phosphate acyltransferase
MQTDPEASVEQGVADLCRAFARGERADWIITPQTRIEALGFDSLDQAELAVALEERYAVRLADHALESLITVGDVAAAVRSGGPSRPRLQARIGWLQPFGKRVGGPLIGGYCRLRVTGIEHVPATGPVIIAANHRSMWDVPLTVVATPRPVVFMAKWQLFGDPFRRWLWWAMGGFPVRREINDLRAIDAALATVEEGRALGLYPEGTRSFDRPMLPFLRGAAWVALRTGTPIVPCAITGTERGAPNRPRVGKRTTVAFGPAIPVERVESPRDRVARAEDLTARLRQAVADLLA